ncbi:ABC transporter permease [Nocardioides bruguierae]|uniref:ABC transporter permease n=1 Tax=Nocardioides bruguierae TaxID=2945102 RepID=A0A9X2IFV6_9ACTN|nr:ABC transporter permease [Nocardioides bruguierae]MCM0620140.1 ABC transporter permease [Nocardioides bruguierae]
MTATAPTPDSATAPEAALGTGSPAGARKAPRTSATKPRHRRVGFWLRLLPFAILVVLAVLGPWLAPMDPERVVGPSSSAPDGEFWFGTDANGMDVLSRVLAAFRLDVTIAIAVTALTTVLAIVIGLVAGMYDSHRGPLGWAARLLGRLIDLVQAIPVMIAGLVVVSFFGRNSLVISLALAVVLVPFSARLMRTEVGVVKHAGYLDAGRLSGESELRILVRRVLPNSLLPVIENTSAIFGMAIIFCAALGFLGVGVPVPTAEWGSMLATGAPDAAVGRWWGVLFPSLALGYAVWSASTLISAFDRDKG